MDLQISLIINNEIRKQCLLIGMVKFIYPTYILMIGVNNHLESHSSFMFGIYYLFPTDPKTLKPNLNYIFVTALFNFKYANKYWK